jgi:hypothetical protein
MKHSTSCCHPESSCPGFGVMVSCRRRLVSTTACFVMMDSDRASISLCHEVDARAALLLARSAYSIGRSLSKFRPVVRTGSVSLGQGEVYPREPLCHYYFRSSRDGVAGLGSFMRIVKCDCGRKIRGVTAFSLSATRVTGELYIAELWHGGCGWLAQNWAEHL